ncbi:MAG: hypothetical protein UX10_C0011G0003 [Candidatus Magasanikbacteria bacterium GW2011_GWA2_45_39]|uniref:Uncharacterized protein n=1 Tax=Candidatus Magasanikbacteria bacterium GW2011_GWA2_45_39 TaxID=1619041 RepID=A0A0G1QFJ7_9BACT|nr:MAG: hypothetical protein UX10_C0011G0003 [Candidatus Magasanikbacteria bacterium GW2011_GWA2_45_39]
MKFNVILIIVSAGALFFFLGVVAGQCPNLTNNATPRNIFNEPGLVVTPSCKTDADCQELKFWQPDLCNSTPKCVDHFCEASVSLTCVNSAMAPQFGIGCNSKKDPDAYCDDHNPCTEDHCNRYYFKGRGGCAHAPVSDTKSCGTGGCAFTMPMCVDYHVNTQTCEEFLKSYIGAPCHDDDMCTEGDKCGIDPQGTFKCLPGTRVLGCK